jgi:hypothetical protein
MFNFLTTSWGYGLGGVALAAVLLAMLGLSRRQRLHAAASTRHQDGENSGQDIDSGYDSAQDPDNIV